MYRQSEKNLLNSNTSSTCPHNMVNFGPLRLWLVKEFGHPSKFQRVSRLAFVTAPMSLTGGQPNCRMFGPLLGWYTIYTFLGALTRWHFARCKIHFMSNSRIFLYWKLYCTALQQRAWAKLCSMVQGMELRNFRTYICLGGHHILVLFLFLFFLLYRYWG